MNLKLMQVVNRIKIRKILTIILVILIQGSTSAQPKEKVDSLYKLLNFSKEDTNKVILLDQIVGEHMNSLVQYDTAYAFIKPGLALARKLKYKIGIVMHLKNLCDFYVRKQNTTKALALIFEAYKIVQDNNLEKRRESIQVLAGISLTYISMKNYKEAVKYKKKELELRTRFISDELYRKINPNQLNGDSLKIALTLSGLSNYYLQLGKIDTALFYGEMAQKYVNNISKKDPGYLANVLNILGNIKRTMGKSNSAINYYRSSIFHAQQSKKKNAKLNGLYKSYWGIADIFRDLNNIDSSIYYAEKAASFCGELNWDKDLLEIQYLLARNYSGIDNTKAVFYYEESTKLREKIFNKEKEEQIANITFNEQERQKDLELQRLIAKEKRKKQIYYSIIGISILLFIVAFIALNRSIITSDKVNTFLAGLSVMMIFKFWDMLSEPYVEFKISDNPAVLFFSAILSASILSPIQKPIKKWLKESMLAKAKAKPKTKKQSLKKIKLSNQ